MAAINVRPYVDQENTNSRTGLKAPRSGPLNAAPVGKNIQKNVQKNLVTPRRALGDVNNIQRIASQSELSVKNRQKIPSMKKAPALQMAGKSFVKPDVKVSLLTVPTVPTADDIEQMHITPDLLDTYEDILPVNKRPSSFIHDVVNWRPDLYSFHQGNSTKSTARDVWDDLNTLQEIPMPDPRECDKNDLCLPDVELNTLDLPPLNFEDCADMFLPMI